MVAAVFRTIFTQPDAATWDSVRDSSPQLAGTGQQRDQTPNPRGRHLSERARCHPPRRRILTDMHDEWQVSERRNLSEGSMAQLKPTSNNETVAAISASD
jgi:hypothetical protein